MANNVKFYSPNVLTEIVNWQQLHALPAGCDVVHPSIFNCTWPCYSSVKYQCENSEVHSPKEKRQIYNNLNDKTKIKGTTAWNPRTLLHIAGLSLLLKHIIFNIRFHWHAISLQN